MRHGSIAAVDCLSFKSGRSVALEDAIA